MLGVVGDMQASVLLLFTPSDAELMCNLLGVEAGTEIGVSALMEIGNIVGTSYVNALAEMTGMEIEPTPPAAATDMLGAIVQSVLGRARRRRRRRAAAGHRPRGGARGLLRLLPARARARRRRPASGTAGPVTMAETMVRMGELAASAVAGDVLVSLGLGSCIGLALVDRRVGAAGLAHVVLPSSGGNAPADAFKFADVAVPELIDRVVALGGRRVKLEAVLVGGASMFATSSASMEVGTRNEAAVRDLLQTNRIPIIATATGGKKGRTIRVHVGSEKVTVKEAGGTEVNLLNSKVAA